MKKRILAIVLTATLFLGILPIAGAAQTDVEAVVKDVGGIVTVNATKTKAIKGTPMMVYILPEDGNADNTVAKINTAVTADDVTVEETTVSGMNSLSIEYASAVVAGENGGFTLECRMKSTLSTGICYVIVHHIGAAGAYLLGSFDHIGENDRAALVDSFDTESDYASIIADDMWKEQQLLQNNKI